MDTIGGVNVIAGSVFFPGNKTGITIRLPQDKNYDIRSLLGSFRSGSRCIIHTSSF